MKANIPTSLTETVHVLLEEIDGRDAVLLGPADTPRGQAQSETTHGEEATR